MEDVKKTGKTAERDPNKAVRLAVEAYEIAASAYESTRELFGEENVFCRIMDKLCDAFITITGDAEDVTNTPAYIVLNDSEFDSRLKANILLSLAATHLNRVPDSAPPVFFTEQQVADMEKVPGGYVHGK